jgi:hypothetical protein
MIWGSFKRTDPAKIAIPNALDIKTLMQSPEFEKSTLRNKVETHSSTVGFEATIVSGNSN